MLLEERAEEAVAAKMASGKKRRLNMLRFWGALAVAVVE